MGVDLTLVPVTVFTPAKEGDEDSGWGFGTDVLALFRRHDLWQPIENLPSEPAPAKFSSHLGTQENGEHGYGQTTLTAYGFPIRMVTGKSLLTLSKHSGVQDNPRNRAVWAFLKAMTPEQQYALYWH